MLVAWLLLLLVLVRLWLLLLRMLLVPRGWCVMRAAVGVGAAAVVC